MGRQVQRGAMPRAGPRRAADLTVAKARLFGTEIDRHHLGRFVRLSRSGLSVRFTHEIHASMSGPTASTSGSWCGLIENREWRFRFRPILHIDFGRTDSRRGFANAFLSLALAEFTIAVRGNLEAQAHRAQMRRLA